MKRALIYVRYANAQFSRGIPTIISQEKMCLNYARINNYSVNKNKDIYSDRLVGGIGINRPALANVLERCRKDEGIDALIISDISRLGRDSETVIYLEKEINQYGIEIHTVNGGLWENSPSNKLFDEMMSISSRFQSIQYGKKVKAGLARKKLKNNKKYEKLEKN